MKTLATIIITAFLTICLTSLFSVSAQKGGNCINADVLNPAVDNISDWSNDSKQRSIAIRDDASLSLGAIVGFLNQNENDGDRVATQIQLIRNEINNPTGCR